MPYAKPSPEPLVKCGFGSEENSNGHGMIRAGKIRLSDVRSNPHAAATLHVA